MARFGFIGCGSMGGTLAATVAKTSADAVLLSNHNPEKAAALAQKTGGVCVSNDEIASKCRYIFLGVKPQMFADVLGKLAPILKSRTDRFVLVSMAAGLTADTVSSMAGGDYPVIRLMPNTPALVGQGVILHCHNALVTEDEIREIADVLSPAGIVDAISEQLIDAASAVSGCGPAFVYMFIEALADGGVKCGLPRAKALSYAAQTVLGSAEMVLSTGEHPGTLKDAVCSPKGSTIAGVAALEEHSFRAAAMDAVVASFERTKELGKA